MFTVTYMYLCNVVTIDSTYLGYLSVPLRCSMDSWFAESRSGVPVGVITEDDILQSPLEACAERRSDVPVTCP